MGYVPTRLVEMPTPKSPQAGDMYFDPMTGAIKIWDGLEWHWLVGESGNMPQEKPKPPHYDRFDLEE